MRIMVVDDSIVFRSQISSALTGVEGIEIVATAANGKIALQKLEQLQVDLITLDMEMPELNGLETLKLIRAKGLKVKVIVFSSQTIRGAEKALEALREGADDVVAKPEGDGVNFESALISIRSSLVPRVKQFQTLKAPTQKPLYTGESILKPQTAASSAKSMKQRIQGFDPQAIVIASSTGGPTALETIFSQLKGPFKKPIFLVQHMPPVFTQILAKRLGALTDTPATEAITSQKVQSNSFLVAPGDYHMVLNKQADGLYATLNQTALRQSVRPAADNLFETASEIYGNQLLGIVLTGMGEDGLMGAKQVRAKGGRVLIQNKESCVVFGMPGACFAQDEYDEIASLDGIVQLLKGILK
jgi:two-component system chemotaxis response regulator CheB